MERGKDSYANPFSIGDMPKIFSKITRNEAKTILAQETEVFYLCPADLDPNDDEDVATPYTGAPYLRRAKGYSDLRVKSNTGIWVGSIQDMAMQIVENEFRNNVTKCWSRWSEPKYWVVNFSKMLEICLWAAGCVMLAAAAEGGENGEGGSKNGANGNGSGGGKAGNQQKRRNGQKKREK